MDYMSLRSVSVLDSGSADFERAFKEMWANNADVMSQLYSGTGALKTDFTRYAIVFVCCAGVLLVCARVHC